MDSLGVFFSLLLVTSSAHGGDGQSTGARARAENFEEAARGYCSSSTNNYDLRLFSAFAKKEIFIESHGKLFTIITSGDNVVITDVETAVANIYDLGERLLDYGDIDIDLSIGIMGSDLAVFWRETYQNRMYNQGLFSVSHEGLVEFCRGRGGVTSHN